MALGAMNNVHTQSSLSNVLLTPKSDDSLGAVSFAIVFSNWLSIVTSRSVETPDLWEAGLKCVISIASLEITSNKQRKAIWLQLALRSFNLYIG